MCFCFQVAGEVHQNHKWKGQSKQNIYIWSWTLFPLHIFVLKNLFLAIHPVFFQNILSNIFLSQIILFTQLVLELLASDHLVNFSFSPSDHLVNFSFSPSFAYFAAKSYFVSKEEKLTARVKSGFVFNKTEKLPEQRNTPRITKKNYLYLYFISRPVLCSQWPTRHLWESHHR